jgi:transcriptional regulator with XRE-family HTH domain
MRRDRKNREPVRVTPVPRGRPLKPVDADASCAARLGVALRELRVARDLTLQALADRIGYSPQHISEVELAQARASKAFVTACDRALDGQGGLLALYPAVRLEQVEQRENRETSRRGALRSSQEVDDVKRRAFLGLGLSVVLLGPEAAARATRDDWDRIAHAWSYEIRTALDRNDLLPGLAADLKRLHTNGGPQRVIAQLSSYVAAIATSNGDTVRASRWSRRARSSAVAAGDTHLYAYATSSQAMQGLYGRLSPGRVVALADDALGATGAPCVGRMKALGAKAQALAMLGRERAASDALAELERTFEKLPRDITREKLSALGYPEETLHHVRSYCAMYGAVPGEAAREEALRLYVDAAWRGPVQIRLHRAASEADATDAIATLSALSAPQRADRFVRQIAMRALDSCESRKVAGAGELREALQT